jgi:hypothetical protein
MDRQFAERYGDLETWHWWFRGRQRILETVLSRELRKRTSLSVVSVVAGRSKGLTGSSRSQNHMVVWWVLTPIRSMLAIWQRI